jgi:hypothetical protein
LKIEEVPPSMIMGLSADRDIIADALRRIVSGKNFTHIAIIHGESGSARAFLLRKSIDAISLPRPLSPGEVADELIRLGKEEALYDPSVNGSGRQKGWEVSMTTMDDSPVAIVRAIWI